MIRLLKSISHCGRNFKEHISQCNGEIKVIKCCLKRAIDTSVSDLWTAAMSFVLEQCYGNPNSSPTTYPVLVTLVEQDNDAIACMGAQVLRELVSSKSAYYDARFYSQQKNEMIDVAMKLLNRDSFQVQYEALEIFHILLETESLSVIPRFETQHA